MKYRITLLCRFSPERWRRWWKCKNVSEYEYSRNTIEWEFHVILSMLLAHLCRAFFIRFFFEKDYTVITIVMKLPLINIYISFQDVCNDNNFNEEIFILISKAFYLLFTAIFHGKIIFNKSGGAKWKIFFKFLQNIKFQVKMFKFKYFNWNLCWKTTQIIIYWK